MSLFRKPLVQNHSTSKTFDYARGEVALKFTLNTDKKNELRDFKELLEKAVADVSEELKPKEELYRYANGGGGASGAGAHPIERKTP